MTGIGRLKHLTGAGPGRLAGQQASIGGIQVLSWTAQVGNEVCWAPALQTSRDRKLSEAVPTRYSRAHLRAQ